MLSILVVLISMIMFSSSNRLYVRQFPPEADQFVLPRIVVFSSYMGKIRYPHMPLLLESMRWNPMVDFKIINIIEKDSEQADEFLDLHKNMSINNVEAVVLTMEEWSHRVESRLNVTIPFDMEWSYKLCDFKPIMAYLFPELSGPKYMYWGFADMDIIWGNFSRFAGWFQGQHSVITGWWSATGAGHFFLNAEWSRRFMIDQDSRYVSLLRDIAYHNLDEQGKQVKPENVVDNGQHSLNHHVKRWNHAHQQSVNIGKDWKDHCFYDEGDSNDWAGPIRWFRGSLQVVHGSPEFPPARELLFYHRPGKEIDFPKQIRYEMFQDMLKYGYLLPYWIPLLSRFACVVDMSSRPNSTRDALIDYRPYSNGCLNHYNKQ